MNLTKEHWNKNDVDEFQEYLKSYEDVTKRKWSTNLLRTSLPVLSLKTVVIKDTVEKIYSGNYKEFLDLMIWEFYENTAINGFIINKIDDFNLKIKYLDRYASLCDNWATCDLLSFNINGYEKEYYDLVLRYIKEKNPFNRRIGVYILFNFIKLEDYIDKIFIILDTFHDEEEYYVNMMIAWLLSECFILQRDKTLKYLTHHKLNKFTINKFVAKCRESRRVSDSDKHMLLKYKVKNME